ncbi:energy transducer TonB [Flavobacterium lindanitolerans]|uniref:Protein TonB n=1 Tax=Flavobacterium lindanitolerans TaxID=428988 RepID=A0A497V5U3_9FLAO|nr:energy transducer TonB [Flavobacterium lindanitolerans]PKW29693.1 protein TonB [Flavobacterium lindanitolerans]RLJ34806.1 protein TonB [Flavobacterium lindanitolerans]
MSNLNIFSQSWNENVFEGRNKEYGAYQLRQENPKTTLKALFFGTLACASLVSIPIISNLLTNKGQGEIICAIPAELPPVTYVNLGEKPKIEPEKATNIIPEKSSAKQTKYVTPIITDNQTTPQDVATIDPAKNIKTGDSDNPGDNMGAVALGNSSIDGTGTEPAFGNTGTATDPGDGIFTNIGLQASPEFPGGIKNFLALVGKNFRLPEIGEKATMKVFVYFVVEKDGTLTNIKVVRDPGYGLGAEAIRVLKSIKTKWKPGIQNDKPVRTAYNLPITVEIKN